MKIRTSAFGKHFLLFSSALVAGSILFLAGQGKAQSLYWDSNAGTSGFGNTTGTWGTNNFWNTDSTGGAGTFSTTTTAANTVNFGTASANYSNTAVGIVSGGVTVNSIVYGAGQTSAINLGTAGNTITLGGSTPTITVGNALANAAQTISSNLSGTAGLAKSGNGTLFLSGTNNYTGGTNVTAGILSFRNTGAKSSGSGTHTFASGTTLGLGVATSGSFFSATDVTNAFSGSMTGNLSNVSVASDTNIGIDTSNGVFTYSADIGAVSRGLVKLGSNNLTLSGNNAYSGRTILTGGSVLVTSFGNVGDLSSPLGTNSTVEFRTGGNLSFTGSTAQSSDKTFEIAQADATFRADGTGDGAITLTANISPTSSTNKTLNLFGGNTNNNTISGNISNGAGGVLSISKNNASTWVLSGDNTYTGTTGVSGGTLVISHANALGSTTGATTVSSGATLGLRNNITTAAEALTLTPNTGGTAMLRNLSGNNTWSGTITSNTATSTNLSRIASDSGKLTLGGTVSLTGSAHQFVLQGDGNIDITGQITGLGIITSATTGIGARKLANDSNNFTGAIRVNGGTLEFTSIANVGASSSALGAPVLADSVINLGFDTNDATLRYVGTAPGGHTTDRVVRLNYTGTTTANYTIQANGAGPLTLSSGITAANGSKTLTLSGTSIAANSMGVIPNGGSGAVSVTKSGAGTWILAGTNTYTGTTDVDQGKLIVDGNVSSSTLTTVASGATIGGIGTTGALTVESGGFIAPGNSTGILNTGNYTQLGLYSAEINGLTAGVNYDQINVGGAVDITGGSLSTLFTGSYSLNDIIFILRNDGADAITGTFTGLSQGAVAATYGGFDWQISYTADTVGGGFVGGNDIALRAIPEPHAALLGGLSLLMALRRRRN